MMFLLLFTNHKLQFLDVSGRFWPSSQQPSKILVSYGHIFQEFPVSDCQKENLGKCIFDSLFVMSIFDTTFPTCKPQFTTMFSLAGVLGWKEIFCFVRCSVFSPCLSMTPSLIFRLDLATFVMSKGCKIDQDKSTNHFSFLAKCDLF